MKYKNNKKIIKTVKIKVSVKFLNFKNSTDKVIIFYFTTIKKTFKNSLKNLNMMTE
jgi:hypothetical protein